MIRELYSIIQILP
jgi:hypothetical protein